MNDQDNPAKNGMFFSTRSGKNFTHCLLNYTFCLQNVLTMLELVELLYSIGFSPLSHLKVTAACFFFFFVGSLTDSIIRLLLSNSFQKQWFSKCAKTTCFLKHPYPNLGLGFPGGTRGKKFICNAGDMGSNPWSGKDLEKELAIHPCILAWKISWTEEPGGL